MIVNIDKMIVDIDIINIYEEKCLLIMIFINNKLKYSIFIRNISMLIM
jgi:hypothetical protein